MTKIIGWIPSNSYILLSQIKTGNMEDQEAYKRAMKRVEAKFGFKIHLAIYVAVSILLLIIHFSSSTEYFWVKWPIMGWGIGVIFHALGVYVFSGRSMVTEEMIKKEMEREASKKP